MAYGVRTFQDYFLRNWWNGIDRWIDALRHDRDHRSALETWRILNSLFCVWWRVHLDSPERTEWDRIGCDDIGFNCMVHRIDLISTPDSHPSMLLKTQIAHSNDLLQLSHFVFERSRFLPQDLLSALPHRWSSHTREKKVWQSVEVSAHLSVHLPRLYQGVDRSFCSPANSSCQVQMGAAQATGLKKVQ